MRKSFRRYANQVIGRIPVEKSVKIRIREDILEMLEERSSGRLEEKPEDLLGSVHDLAAEFCENMDLGQPVDTEIISNIMILGVPLYHITKNQFQTAKGILAIGPSAVGIIAIGGAAVGIISIGGLAVGVISLGGIASAVLLAIGGLAVSMNVALGGFAVGLSLAIGGYASAQDVAIGGVTTGRYMLYNQSFNIPDSLQASEVFAFRSPDESESFKALIQELLPNLKLLSRLFLRSFLKL